jgi:hypothetical protein
MRALFFIILLCLPIMAQESVSRVVKNMSELRALDPVPSKPMVEVLGYYTPGDGGGGTYVLTNTVSGTNAYGGRIVASGGGKSWDLQGQPNAEQFGCYGDGSNDDATILNSAIAFCASQGKTLLLTKRYKTSSWIKLPSNTSLDGDGRGTIVRAWTAANRGAIQNEPLGGFGSNPQAPEVIVVTTNITLRNLSVINENASVYTNSNLITMWGVSGLRISNCNFGGATNGIADNWISSFWADDVQVDNSVFENGPGRFCDGLHIVGGRRYNISNCRIIGGDDAFAALQVYDQTLSDVTVSSCYLRSYNAHCIRIGRWTAVTPSSQTNWVERISIVGCTGEFGKRNGGLYIEDQLVSGTNYTKLIRDITVADTSLRLNESYDALGSTNGYPFIVKGGSNVVFNNVTIENGINPSQVAQVERFQANRLRVRNSTFQTLITTGNKVVVMDNCDIANDRVNTLWESRGDEIVLINGGVYYTPGGTIMSKYGPTGTISATCAYLYGTGGNGFNFVDNPETIIISNNRFSSSMTPVIFSGGAYPATTVVFGNFGQADILNRPTASTFVGNQTISGVLTLLTPNFAPYAIATRLDSGAKMEFSFDTSYPSWTTTNANWFQYWAGLGMYGRNTNANSTDKSWIPAAVQHYDTAQGVAVGMHLNSTATTSVGTIGGGTSVGKALTTVDIAAAANNTTATGTRIVRVKTTGVAVDTAGISSDPVRPLDVRSSSQGWLPPRLTTTQGDSISTPVAGESWYDSTVNRPRFYNGTRNYYSTPSLYGSTTQDPASIAAGANLDLSDVTLTGVKANDLVFVADPGFSSSLCFKGSAPSDNTVRIRIVNAGTSPTDLGSTTFRFIVVPQ